jgi:hypothetical protein
MVPIYVLFVSLLVFWVLGLFGWSYFDGRNSRFRMHL